MTPETTLPAFPAEITVLGLSTVLLLCQVLAQAVALDLAGGLGVRYLLGPRDEGRAQNSVLVGRLLRALRNLLETYGGFVALALALVLTGKAGGIGALGAWIWLGARIAYVLLYAAGIPLARSLAWLVSIGGLLLMLARLLA